MYSKSLILVNNGLLHATNNHAHLPWMNESTAIIKRIFMSISMMLSLSVGCYLIRLTMQSITNLQCVWVEHVQDWYFHDFDLYIFTLINFLLRQTSNTLSANLDAYGDIKRMHCKFYTNLKLSARLLYFDIILYS